MSTDPNPEATEEAIMDSLPEGVRTEGQEESLKNAEAFLETIQSGKKDYAETARMLAVDQDIERFPTGSPRLDYVLGGGWPRGRVIELFGKPSSGKTTLSTHAIKEMQKQGGGTLFVDMEGTFDRKWAGMIGVDTDACVKVEPKSGEEAMNLTYDAVKSDAIDLVVVDSVTACIPQAELEGDIGDNHVGLLARLMSQSCRKIAAECEKTGTTVIFINQIRMKIGVKFGNPETTPGGRALKFYSSIRMRVSAKNKPDTDDRGIPKGHKVYFKCKKNKTAPPKRQCECYIQYPVDENDNLIAAGLDIEDEIVDLAVEEGVFVKSGSWYSSFDKNGEEHTVAQGRDALREVLRENPRFYQLTRSRLFEDEAEPEAEVDFDSL